jgi:hypothetical protein
MIRPLASITKPEPSTRFTRSCRRYGLIDWPVIMTTDGETRSNSSGKGSLHPPPIGAAPAMHV